MRCSHKQRSRVDYVSLRYVIDMNYGSVIRLSFDIEMKEITKYKGAPQLGAIIKPARRLTKSLAKILSLSKPRLDITPHNS